MNTQRTRFAITALLVFAIFAFTGQICRKNSEQAEPVTLVFWNLWDDSDVMETVIGTYLSLPENKHLEIEYTKKTIETYESELLNTLASASTKGPHIFTIANTWIPGYTDKITARPADLGTAKEFSQSFVDVATKDLVIGEQVIGIPLYVDTLALYYNKDLLNSAGITRPPQTWTEFNEAVKKLTIIDENTSEITQAGAAIGTANNVSRAQDILALLMMQSGATMIDAERGVLFNADYEQGGATIRPGLNSLVFYTNFANARQAAYTWNPRENNAIDAFTSGKAAMMIGYQYNTATIQAKAPKLNFGVATVPQIETDRKKMTLANYWPLVVAANATPAEQREAWKFLNYVYQTAPVYAEYLKLGQHPTAKRENISAQSEDPLLGVFAEQALFATSWFQPDTKGIDTIFVNMIQSVVLGSALPEEAISEAAAKVQTIFEQYQDREQQRREAQQATEEE